MPITQDRITKLRSFGLSEYAARAYLALLDLGTAEARDASSISKVPQAKIYHVLEQLHEKGLVVILPEFPKKYVPVPFEDYVNRIHDEHANAAAAIEAERDELAEMFAVVGDTDVGNRGFFTVIRGRRNVLSKIEEMIQGANSDLLIFGTTGTAGRAQHMSPALARAKERGVRVRMLTPISADTLPHLTQIADKADIRARDLVEETPSRKVAIIIADGIHAFLIHFVPDDVNLYAGKDIGVFTDQEAMVAAIQTIVEPHWVRAADLASKRLEIESGRAPEFARVHTSAQDVRAALESALEDATDVQATIADPLDDVDDLGRLLRKAAASAKSVRALVNASTVAAADALEALAATDDAIDARHLPPRVAVRQWVIDEREAFFAMAATPSGGERGELVIHTNNRAVVASMRQQFEDLWRTGLTLPTRRKELEAFPHVQPGELGIGILFGQIQDAVLVCDQDGTIHLWNPAASRMFGHDPHDALGLKITALANDHHAEALERALGRAHAAGRDQDAARAVVETTCRRVDGSTIEVDWLVSPLVHATARGKLVLCIGREISDAKRADRALQTGKRA